MTMEPTPINDTWLSGKPFYCKLCGAGMGEYMACEEPDLTDEAVEFLAVAHEQAKKPLVAVDLRSGNLGKMGVAWVETKTALAAIQAALEANRTDVEELREALARLADSLEREGQAMRYLDRRDESRPCSNLRNEPDTEHRS